MNTQKYAAALLSFLAFIGGSALAALIAPGGFTASNLTGFIPLVVSGVVMFFVPLANSGWQGWIKSAVEGLGAVGALLVPALFNGGEFTATQWLLLGVGIVKAIATALGVVIRTDAGALNHTT